MKPALALLSLLLLSGCFGWFGDSVPDQVSGDSDGVVFKGSGDTDRRNAAAAYCSTFNKSAIILPAERSDSSSLSRFACR
ncbi:MAG TPA: hypothetical protein VL966_14915 [Alphaproteobacteria bacterium]|jgi:hypothetical protein|nr:hypothetical protein [Alphaproteobacteria bacterium]